MSTLVGFSRFIEGLSSGLLYLEATAALDSPMTPVLVVYAAGVWPKVRFFSLRSCS
jgi:hypothetical protein